MGTQSQLEKLPRGQSRSHGFRVLVLGDQSVGSYIRRGLEKRGCECSLAASGEDAASLVSRNDFDLVISTVPLEQNDPLLSQLTGSQCTVVSYQPDQSICCWLPVMRRGTKCFGAPALRPIDFISHVDRMLTESNDPAAASKRARGELWSSPTT